MVHGFWWWHHNSVMWYQQYLVTTLHTSRVSCQIMWGWWVTQTLSVTEYLAISPDSLSWSSPLCYDWQNNFYFVKRLTSANVEDLVMVIVPVSAMEGQAITQTRAQGVRMVEVEKQSCRDGDGWWWMSCDPPDTCGIIRTMCPHCYNQGNQTHHM